MIFSSYKTRNIYPQSDIFNFEVLSTLDNTTGLCYWGFSGDSNKIDFCFSSGQISLINPQDLLLYSYNENEINYISGNVGKNSLDIWINNKPFVIGLNKNTGFYNYFYVDAKNIEANINLTINGDSPNYSYSPFQSFYSGQIIPLNIVNSGNFPFKIFSGEIINNSNFYISGIENLDVTGNKNINIIANNFTSTEQEIIVNLYTNFGDISLPFSASGISEISGGFYLFLGPNNSIIINNQPNSYLATINSYTGTYLITSLEYISGYTGKYYENILNTGISTGNVSGLIEGSGYIYNLGHTGIILKYNSLLSQNETGIGTGILSKYRIASGFRQDIFEVDLFGYGSGRISVTAPITGTGEFLFQGTIGPNGGVLSRSNLSGSGSGMSDFGIYIGYTESGVGTIFVPYTGSNQITGFFNSSQYESVQYLSDLIYFTGNIEKYYVISGLSWATGGRITGQLLGEFGYNFEPGRYLFRKDWTGIGSGFSAILDSFNPVLYEFSMTGTTGIIGGTYYTGFLAEGCNFEEPFFIPTGIPSQIYNISGYPVDPIDIMVLTPLNTGEYTGDNSDNINSRTNISRRGNTPSGTGYFDQVFQQPFHSGGIWTETLSGFNETEITNQTGMIKSVFANSFVFSNYSNPNPITGYFVITGNYTGYQNFKWNGRVSGANFSDYRTIISGISNTGIKKTFVSSYDFEIALKTGKYAFYLMPFVGTGINDYNINPYISFYKNISVSMLDQEVKIPFTLFRNSNETITVYVNYLDGSAINGINYEGYEYFINFDNGYAGTEYITIPLKYFTNYTNGIAGQIATQYFDVIITDVVGGYVSNKENIISDKIRVNIIPPVYTPGVVYPTGTILPADQVMMCNNLLGNQYFEGQNGNYNETITLSSPVPTGSILPFRLKFSGINDRLVLRAYSTTSPSLVFFDNANALLEDVPYYFETGIGLMENVYAINAQVQGGYTKISAPRKNWFLSTTCDITTNNGQYSTNTECETVDYTMFSISGFRLGFDVAPSLSFAFDGISSGIDSQFIGFSGCTSTVDQITGADKTVYAFIMPRIYPPYESYVVINHKNIRQDFPGVAQYYYKMYANPKVSDTDTTNKWTGYLSYSGFVGGVTGKGSGFGEGFPYISGGKLINKVIESPKLINITYCPSSVGSVSGALVASGIVDNFNKSCNNYCGYDGDVDYIYIYNSGCVSSYIPNIKIFGLGEDIEKQTIGVCPNPHNLYITGNNGVIYMSEQYYQQPFGPFRYTWVINHRLIQESFPNSSYTVSFGGIENPDQLVELRFNYFVYKGGTNILDNTWTGTFACQSEINDIPFRYLNFVSGGKIISNGKFFLTPREYPPCDINTHANIEKRLIKINPKGGLLII